MAPLAPHGARALLTVRAGPSSRQRLNPPSFVYGKGGAAMRSEDATSGYMGSADHDAFLNRYSTASAAEDKAEVWAATMTSAELLVSQELQSKSELLMARAVVIDPAMASASIWGRIRAAQERAKDDDDVWEEYTTDSGRPWWFNRLTFEKRCVERALDRPKREALTRTCAAVGRRPARAGRWLAPLLGTRGRLSESRRRSSGAGMSGAAR